MREHNKSSHQTTPENCQMLCRDCNLKKGAQ
ncbi:MAG: HNH endonuclease [Clostridia bacterium]|nr:HNH endonuclease [Clostridia bacterium]MBR5428401.1 HNH endonuclease [Clostridia bacterium]